MKTITISKKKYETSQTKKVSEGLGITSKKNSLKLKIKEEVKKDMKEILKDLKEGNIIEL